MQLKARITSLAGVGLLAAGMALVPAVTASASDCYTGVDTNGAFGYCGAQTHRVRVLCVNRWFGTGHWNYGPWVEPGRSSYANCDWTEYIQTPINVETR